MDIAIMLMNQIQNFVKSVVSLYLRSLKNGKANSRKKSNLVELPEPTNNGITIEFPYTTAQSFEFALKEASKFDTFEQFGNDKSNL